MPAVRRRGAAPAVVSALCGCPLGQPTVGGLIIGRIHWAVPQDGFDAVRELLPQVLWGLPFQTVEVAYVEVDIVRAILATGEEHGLAQTEGKRAW